ncbi:MAG: dTMP kinase, partial [Deltaproteobacteria bacterium]|nr:dTMP kinase [Deltaproteobacteria bacterium]
MRIFLAISLPDEIRAAVVRIQAALRDGVGPASWTRPEAMHLTLRFLGEVDPARTAALATALGPALADLAPVVAAVVGGGAFPDVRRPRVLWVGIEEDGGLRRIAERIEDVCMTLGFSPADRPFQAHLTLARIRADAPEARHRREGARDAVQHLRNSGLIGRFTAREVILFSSDRTLSGVVHTPLAAFPLGGRPAGEEAAATDPGRETAGRLLAVEGLDGSGGTTQVGRLAAALRDRGLDVVTTGEPSRGPVGALIREALGRGDEGDERLLPYLFAADRRDHLDREILPALARGAWVVTDRYLASSLAYQSLTVPFEHVSALNERFPVPDLTLFLALDPALCLDRVSRRGEARELFENLDHLRRIEA